MLWNPDRCCEAMAGDAGSAISCAWWGCRPLGVISRWSPVTMKPSYSYSLHWWDDLFLELGTCLCYDCAHTRAWKSMTFYNIFCVLSKGPPQPWWCVLHFAGLAAEVDLVHGFTLVWRGKEAGSTWVNMHKWAAVFIYWKKIICEKSSAFLSITITQEPVFYFIFGFSGFLFFLTFLYFNFTQNCLWLGIKLRLIKCSQNTGLFRMDLLKGLLI